METYSNGRLVYEGFGPVDDDRRTELRSIGIAMIALSVTSVCLRFLARHVSKAKPWWDDYTIVVALVLSIGLNSCLIVGINNGLGRHSPATSPLALMEGGKILISSQLMYMASTNAAKISIILFYHRIFGSNQAFKRATTVGSTVVVCWLITGFCMITFQCTPVRYFWNKSVAGGSCTPLKRIWIASGLGSLFTDILILCLPIPMVWQLQIPKKQKFALSGVFLLGGFVCITSILRLVAIDKLRDYDLSWTLTSSIIWTSIECSIGVVSACLPTLRPLFGKLLAATKRSKFGTSFGRTVFAPRAMKSYHVDESDDTMSSSKYSHLPPPVELERYQSPLHQKLSQPFSSPRHQTFSPTGRHHTQSVPLPAHPPRAQSQATFKHHDRLPTSTNNTFTP